MNAPFVIGSGRGFLTAPNWRAAGGVAVFLSTRLASRAEVVWLLVNGAALNTLQQLGLSRTLAG